VQPWRYTKRSKKVSARRVPILKYFEVDKYTIFDISVLS